MSQDLPSEILYQIALEATSGKDFLNWLLSCKHMKELLTGEIEKMLLKLVEIKRKNKRGKLHEYLCMLCTRNAYGKYPTFDSYGFRHLLYTPLSKSESSRYIRVNGCQKYMSKFDYNSSGEGIVYFSILDHCFKSENGKEEGCEILCLVEN
jgi:hypothetical protein